MNVKPENLRLYGVTDRTWLGEKTLAQQVEASLRGGVTMIQLREKTLGREALAAEAKEIQALCRKHQVPFLLNDDVDLALELGADGVHVGQKDMEAGAARAKLGPDKILGVSAKTVEQALAAQAAGADYLGVGAVFPTGTKGDATPVSREMVAAITAAVDIPVVAIGGVTQENAKTLAGLGLAGVAVVSALYAQPDPCQAARRLGETVAEMTAQG